MFSTDLEHCCLSPLHLLPKFSSQPAPSNQSSEEFCGHRASLSRSEGATHSPAALVCVFVPAKLLSVKPAHARPCWGYSEHTTDISRQLQDPSGTFCPPGLQLFWFQDPPTLDFVLLFIFSTLVLTAWLWTSFPSRPKNFSSSRLFSL